MGFGFPTATMELPLIKKNLESGGLSFYFLLAGCFESNKRLFRYSFFFYSHFHLALENGTNQNVISMVAAIFFNPIRIQSNMF